MYHPRRDDSAHHSALSALEGTAVHTALVGRILLMRSDADAVERAVVFVAVVILAVLDAAVNAAVYMIIKHLLHLKVNCQSTDIIIITER